MLLSHVHTAGHVHVLLKNKNKQAAKCSMIFFFICSCTLAPPSKSLLAPHPAMGFSVCMCVCTHTSNKHKQSSLAGLRPWFAYRMHICTTKFCMGNNKGYNSNLRQIIEHGDTSRFQECY